MIRTIVITASLAVTALPAAADCHRLIVKYHDVKGQTPATTQQMRRLQSAGGVELHYRRTLSNGAHLVEKGGKLAADADTDHRTLLTRLQADPEVEYAECDARRHASVAPDDPYYESTLTAPEEQWYLKNNDGGIRAEQAWDITMGDNVVVTAVVDSGIQSHSELARLLDGYDFVSEDAPLDFFTANDGDGRDEDETDPGDWVEEGDCGDGEPARDSSWHGTRIAGIIAAETNNGAGIAGIDWNGSVLPVRALGRCGGFLSDIADAIRWAAGLSVVGVPDNPNPADVINLSLGSSGQCSNTEQSAINAAVEAGALVVVAAGNEGTDTSGIAPANCNNVVVVAATTRQGSETCYTNAGEEVDLSAPGGNSYEGACSSDPAGDAIYSTSNDSADRPENGGPTIEPGAGTSFATPLVSGAAALLRAVAPSLTPLQLETVLKDSARTFPDNTTTGFGPCDTSRCGTGILDINNALQTATGIDATPASFSFTDRTSVEPGETVISDAATIEDINIAVPISIDNGEYSVDGGDFTDEDGYVEAGQQIRIRLTAADSYVTRVEATLTAGGVSDTFSVTTKSRQTIPSSSGGGGGGSTNAAGLILLAASLFAGRRRR